jgi:galactokinase
MTSVSEIFSKKFKGTPAIFIAPGRINLIGEHTDYNEGFVMPAAIDFHVTFAIALNKTGRFNLYAIDYNEEASFSIDDVTPGHGWVNYLMGVVDGLRKEGRVPEGVDCVFGSTIPVGAGLSSSAALCCGFGYALASLQTLNLTLIDIARIGQYSEHKFAGVQCGIMDQFASLHGKKNSALLLDCKTLEYETLPIDLGDYRIMLIDTKVKHALASTEYNDRRAACEEGVRKIGNVNSLRDVTIAMLNENQDKLGEDVYIKCRFVVEEIGRTKAAAGLLKKRDIKKFGALLYETHWGLSRAYDVSCEELDFLVSLVEDHKEFVIGARMMGGGFGGCTINLIHESVVDFMRGYVHEKYFATFKKEPAFYLVNLADGVHKE